MKKIGRGWQYTTYDIGNGRVLKKYNSELVGYIHMFRECFPFKNDQLWKLPKYYKGCREEAVNSIQKVLDEPLDAWMMGNPKILNALDYEQDKLIPLGDYLREADMEAGKRAIDAFVEFNKWLVSKSLIDKSFNITKNFALDGQGRIVLMDLGELYSSREAIEKQVAKRAWAEHYVVDPLPRALQQHFVNSMDRTFFKRELDDGDVGEVSLAD